MLLKLIERLPQLVAGSTQTRFGDKILSDLLQSVNYVECHDNHTLWDRLVLSNPNAPDLERKQMHQLAKGLTLISHGIPFLHVEQEFFRTKIVIRSKIQFIQSKTDSNKLYLH